MTSHYAGLYIHIPFCRGKCPYCDFYSTANLSRITDFTEALKKEICIYKRDSRFPPFDTIYFGGGTPSLLSPYQLNELLGLIQQTFNFSKKDIEITLESNPRDLSQEYLSSIRQSGVNRLNIGIQSFNAEILSFLGRRHTSEDAVKVFGDARKTVFDNIGIDLIYAIPGQSQNQWARDIEKAISLGPEHISCYQLTIAESTVFGIRQKKGALIEQDEESQYKFFYKNINMLEKAGYQHYEISNFAKSPSLFSKHNQKYWSHVSYLGLGPAAHSYIPQSTGSRPKRWWNYYPLKEYIENLKQDRLPIAGSEFLNDEALKLESLYLGLRTYSGINLDSFYKEYGQDLRRHPQRVLEMLEKEDLATVDNNILRLTTKGLALCDHIATLW